MTGLFVMDFHPTSSSISYLNSTPAISSSILCNVCHCVSDSVATEACTTKNLFGDLAFPFKSCCHKNLHIIHSMQIHLPQKASKTHQNKILKKLELQNQKDVPHSYKGGACPSKKTKYHKVQGQKFKAELKSCRLS